MSNNFMGKKIKGTFHQCRRRRLYTFFLYNRLQMCTPYLTFNLETLYFFTFSDSVKIEALILTLICSQLRKYAIYCIQHSDGDDITIRVYLQHAVRDSLILTKPQPNAAVLFWSSAAEASEVVHRGVGLRNLRTFFSILFLRN